MFWRENKDFYVRKSDLRLEENPALWRIDGDVLLQKFVPFEDEGGKILYKNTSIYCGWTPRERKKYLRVPVTYVEMTKQSIIVEFNLDEIKFFLQRADGFRNENQIIVNL